MPRASITSAGISGLTQPRDAIGKTSFRPDEQAFAYHALVFFKRALDSVNVIAIPDRHLTYDLVVARSRRSTDQMRNAGHHFANAELANCPPPPQYRRATVTTQTLFGRCPCHDKMAEQNRFFQGRTERHTSRSRSMRKSESAAKPSSALMGISYQIFPASPEMSFRMS